MDSHAKLYKNAGKEAESSRRRRTEQTVELRRQKRGQDLNKRRNIDINAEYESETTDNDKDKKFEPKMTIAEAKQLLLNNPDQATLRNVFEALRRMLSRTTNPPIDEVVNEGLVVALVQGLSVEDDQVQYEAAWALTNVVSGTQAHTVAAANAGATKAFIQRASNSNDALAEQCFWGLANIVGDSAVLRDHAIECGIIPLMMSFVERVHGLSISFARTLAWIASNLSRHKDPQISLDLVSQVLPAIKYLLMCKDETVRQDTCWALSYLTDCGDAQLHLIMKYPLLDEVRALLQTGSNNMMAPAVRVFGNFVSGNDKITQTIIDTGILGDELPQILNHASVSVVKEACWLLSNILAGTENQIKAVIDANVMPMVLQHLRHGDFKVQSEAAWAVGNLCHSGNAHQVYYLVELDFWECVVPVLNIRHVEFLQNVLHSCRAVLNAISVSHPERLEEHKQRFEELGGVDFVEDLQNHTDNRIYELSYDIISGFFQDEGDDDTDAQFAPMDPLESNFKF
uniref:Importin subunit alpha n=1 Tax=Panagrellus redivivus TaxID=6233 RepID=A0A7E4ZUJ3_PANRE